MDYRERIAELLKLAGELDLARLYELVETGRLDDYFQAFLQGEEWIGRLLAIQPEAAALASARSALTKKCDGIRRFYLKYFSTHRLLGDSEAADAPDLVFILACKSPAVLRLRVEGAAAFIREHPGCRVVLCGGGFDPETTEAEVMLGVINELGLCAEDILVEDDSIDTVANAVFAKLRLRLAGKLPASGNLLVVTSAFHATRSLNIFRRVFGPSYRIAALPVRTTSCDAETARLAAHELRTEERSTREIFGMTHPLSGVTEGITPGDDTTLFYQLVLHHDFYRHRYDLIRKYGPALHAAEPEKLRSPTAESHRWSFAFVPMGSDLKGRVPANAIALDVGSGVPIDGIFDHHHRPGAYDSAAAMALDLQDRIRARLEPAESKCLILHRDPDLDCLASATIAWAAVENADKGQWPAYVELAALCSRADQGREPISHALTLYTLVLMLPTWLNSEEGRRFLRESIDDLKGLSAERGLAFDAEGDRQAALATIGLLLVLHVCEREAAPVGGELAASAFEGPLRNVAGGVTRLLETQMKLCEAEIARARENAWVGEMRIRGVDGQPVAARYVRSIDPRANPGVLAKTLWAGAAPDDDMPVVAIIQTTVGNRTVVSVNPDMDGTLKGLAYRLEQMEQEHEQAEGIADMGAARYRYTDKEGRERVDPLFQSSDPWYDGRGHGYTIVDTPGCGTLLTLDEVFEAVIAGNWIELGAEYDRPEYRLWLDGHL